LKRSRLSLDDITDWHTLMTAFGRAALGKRGRPDVEAYRITPHRILLSRRRKQRCAGARRVLERAFSARHISESDLQHRMDAILAFTAQADATFWRRQNLLRHPFAGYAAGA